MHLRERLTGVFSEEVWLTVAAERLADAVALGAAERFLGAAYLLGYAAETRLKAAVWHVLPLPAEGRWEELAGHAEAVRRAYLGEIDTEGGHSLRSWALVLQRAMLRRRLDPERRALLKTVVNRTVRISLEWSVELRYSSIDVDEALFGRLRVDVQELSEALDDLRS